MENFDNILLIMVAVIFGLTAVLALASIPDWIKIPEWYKKKLFLALIIEIVAIVIAYLTSILPAEKEQTPKVVSPEINREQSLKLDFDSTKKDFYIVNEKKEAFGKFSIGDLEAYNVFNEIVCSPNRSDDSHILVRWNQKNGGAWESSSDSIAGCPLYMKISDKNSQTIYEIINKNSSKEYEFTTKGKTDDYFNRNQRRVHIEEYTDTKNGKLYYCLFRIVDANLQGDSKNVYVLQMRIAPYFNKEIFRKQKN